MKAVAFALSAVASTDGPASGAAVAGSVRGRKKNKGAGGRSIVGRSLRERPPTRGASRLHYLPTQSSEWVGPPSRGGPGCRSARGTYPHGSSTVNVVSTPGLDVNPIVPPWASTRLLQI